MSTPRRVSSASKEDADHSQIAQEESTMIARAKFDAPAGTAIDFVHPDFETPTASPEDGPQTLLQLTKRIDGPFNKARKCGDYWYAQFDNGVCCAGNAKLRLGCGGDTNLIIANITSQDQWDIIPQDKELVNGFARGNWNQFGMGADFISATRRIPTTPKPYPGFRGLPTELRLQIWELALPESRMVDLSTYEGSLFPQKLFFGEAHLLTCQESREVFLKHYSNMQRTKGEIHSREPADWNIYHRYVDEVRDTLVVDCIQDMFPYLRYDYSRVQNIALTDPHGHGIKWYEVHRLCPALKQITAVLGHPPFGHKDQNCHLIDVENGLNDLVLADTVPQRSNARWFTDWERYIVQTTPTTWSADVQDLMRESHKLRNREGFNEYKQLHQGVWDGIQLKVAVLGKESMGDLLFQHRCSHTWLDPIQTTMSSETKAVSDMNISTLRPVYHQSAIEIIIGTDFLHDRRHYHMLTSEVDGTLCTRYDGIKELFDLSENRYSDASFPKLNYVRIEEMDA